MAEAFAQGDLRSKTEVTLKSGGIGVCGGYITWLHRNQFLVSLEVVVFGQDAGTEEFLLEDLHKVEEILRLAATYIIYSVRSLSPALSNRKGAKRGEGNYIFELKIKKI